MNKDTEKKITELLRRLEQPLAAIMATETIVNAAHDELLELSHKNRAAFNKLSDNAKQSSSACNRQITIDALDVYTNALWELRDFYNAVAFNALTTLKTLVNYKE